MPAAPFPLTRDVPETLSEFIHERCRVPAEALRVMSADALPAREHRLLVHPNDMTSTLATFHGSPLRVEVLQRVRIDDLYLREVFLRTTRGDRVVEYGVIGIALSRYTAAQQQEILAGRTPLGAVLHQFDIPFESSPIGFFSVAAERLPEAHRAVFPGGVAHGRFNRLARSAHEPLAWIMEILPPA